MSTRVIRLEVLRRMTAQQESKGSSPVQGWSKVAEDSTAEPGVSSDSDVEMLDDPGVERREWRLRKTVDPTGDRLTPGQWWSGKRHRNPGTPPTMELIRRWGTPRWSTGPRWRAGGGTRSDMRRRSSNGGRKRKRLGGRPRCAQPMNERHRRWNGDYGRTRWMTR